MSFTTYTNLSANTNSDSGAIIVPAPGRQTDGSPHASRRNLYHASVHTGETKRLILVERQHVLQRGTWMALSAMAEAITHLVVALDRHSARKRWRAKA